ncbi:Ig-like domain-containing protein [Burkholderia stabilis]|uniref:Ig-like domain-containing protein n=1 Tax=Burkholderia stabilis TaxID=95485 RepID=UPI001F4B3539|nr:Ig-like domain-containing protein [Burkholderia stabilis]
MAAKATKRPSRPMIDSVMDNVPPYTGVIAKGGLTNDPRPMVNGRGEAGSIIHIMVDGREAGTAVVASNGTWSFALSKPLTDGEYRLTARASNDVGLSIPSTSYGIQVDTTPPSQPKIETAAEGVQPVLSGRAEAYSTVTVYDGKTMLGTVKTAVDGTWSFQLPVGLSNGKHVLTVTAMDPAGNTSMASAGFDVTVGSVVPPTQPNPVAQALLDEMGRDSGSFNFDRLTNNGTAGRLMSGRVSGTLATGEKVQVSTDGGRTWQDAVMKSDGTWMAIDPNTHTGNWTVQTRVVNEGGTSGPLKAYDVELDTISPNAPSSAIRSGNVIDVSLGGTNAMVGDSVNVMIGDHRITYALTAADIAVGKARVTIPSGIAAMMDEHSSYGAALVDRSGNVSHYLVTRFAEIASSGSGSSGINYKVVDFNNEAPRDLTGGGVPVNFGHFSLSITSKMANQGIRVAGGNTIGSGIKPEAGETGLLIDMQYARFYLNNGEQAQALTLDLGLPSYSVNKKQHAIDFYDEKGVLVYREYFMIDGYFAPGLEIHKYNFVMPSGVKFSSFGFSAWAEWDPPTGRWSQSPGYASGLVWIDNVGFAGEAFGSITPNALVDFNSEAPRDLFGSSALTDFGLFSLSLTSKAAGQGIRVAGGNTIAGGFKPDAGETGLLVDMGCARYYLNNGAHARSLSIDFGLPDVKNNLAIDFYDDAGNMIHRKYLNFGDVATPKFKIYSYTIVMPDDLQFASFGFTQRLIDGQYHWDFQIGLAWIDNIGFGGGSFANSTWQSTTELVPPADIQHVLDTADAAYYGSAHGTEFQVDHVSYFSGTHAGLYGGAGVDTLKLTGANESLDLSKLLNVGGTSKLSSIEIVDITGTGNNTLKLSMSDVLELGHEDVFRADGHTQLMVKGNAGDRVELSGMAGLDAGHWSNQGMVAVNGAAYVVYENSTLNVELLVQSAVTTQLV